MQVLFAGAIFVVPALGSFRLGMSIPGLSQANVFMTFLPLGMTFGGAFVGNELHISDQTVICSGPKNDEIWYWATLTNPRSFEAEVLVALNAVS